MEHYIRVSISFHFLKNQYEYHTRFIDFSLDYHSITPLALACCVLWNLNDSKDIERSTIA